MEYRTGKVDRVVVARFDEGDDFLGGLKDLLTREEIRQGWFHILGGLREAEVVTGPRAPVMPPEPVWDKVSGARETLGSGTIFWDGSEPKIHLHAAMGHHGDTLTACVRKGTKVYLILEVIIFELTGFEATRPWFDQGGFNRLTFR
jgi:predicted DNA-binding protein with PD1-like motif